jgi:hypothetical protein
MLPKGRVKSESSNGSLPPNRLGIKPKPQRLPKGSPIAKKSFLPCLSLCIFYGLILLNTGKQKMDSWFGGHQNQA